MRLSDTCRLVVTRTTLAVVTVAAATALVAARPMPQAPVPAVPTVAVSALEPLLPAPAGWTKTRSSGNRFEAADCTYAYADAVFIKDEMKVRLTVSDSGRNPDSVLMLASLVTTFPDGYTGRIGNATTITRLRLNDVPAGARWDAEKNEGEFTVLVGGRFVAKAEGTVDSLDTLRALVAGIDLKRLSELK